MGPVQRRHQRAHLPPETALWRRQWGGLPRGWLPQHPALRVWFCGGRFACAARGRAWTALRHPSVLVESVSGGLWTPRRDVAVAKLWCVSGVVVCKSKISDGNEKKAGI